MRNNGQRREELLKIIEEFEIPMTSFEAREYVERMSDEEVVKLVLVYSDIRDYQEILDESLRRQDPKKYAEIEKEYRSKLEALDKEFVDEMEKIQEEEDLAMDSQEAKVAKEIDEIVTDFESDVNRIVEEHQVSDSKSESVSESKKNTPAA